jgi:predicted membrane protein
MKPRTIIGIVLIVAGAWKLANMWGIIENDWLWRQPWTTYIAPAALIYLGVLVIVNSYRRDPDQWLQRPLPIGEEGKRICCSVQYGGDEYIYRGEPFHGARLDAFCGGIRMDLRNATITEDEEIDIHTFMGGIELLVPANVNVIVKSRSFIGGVGNDTAMCSDKNAHNLHITASNFFGGVSVKNEEFRV